MALFVRTICKNARVWSGSCQLVRQFNKDIRLAKQNVAKKHVMKRERRLRFEKDDLTWGYDAHNGPHTWSRYHIGACGANQSPVNIETKRVVHDTTLVHNPLKLEQTMCSKPLLINHGRGFRLEFETDAKLTGGPLTATYSFEQLHMHWGLSRNYGSEHAINGRTYAAEMHIVFFDKKRFSSFNEAIRRSDPDGLCVLAVFIEEGDVDDPVMESVLDLLPKVSYRDQKVDIPLDFLLDSFLPEDYQDYYTYPGSLTTPPCSEVVQWIIFKNRIVMSERQLNICRSIRETFVNAGNHTCCEVNFRPFCPLGSRVIRSSFPMDTLMHCALP